MELLILIPILIGRLIYEQVQRKKAKDYAYWNLYGRRMSMRDAVDDQNDGE